MPACVVPGCINLCQEWMTLFPRSARLASRWVAAIEAGTGQKVEQFEPQDSQICNMHFAITSQKTDENTDEYKYREPTLFFRENLLIQIGNCELCLGFDMVCDMYKLSERIDTGDNETLYSLARKFFNFPKKRPQIYATRKGNQKVMKAMTREKLIFRNNRGQVAAVVQPVTTISLDSSDEPDEGNSSNAIALDSDSDSNGMEQFEDIIVKEEPQVDFLNSSEQKQFTSAPQVPKPLNQFYPNKPGRHKCYICNETFQDNAILTGHVSSIHFEKYKRSCKNCNRSFFSALYYNEHMATHKPYSCNHCSLEFVERREVVLHEVQEHAVGNLHEYCGCCGKLFRSKSSLEEHMKAEHPSP